MLYAILVEDAVKVGTLLCRFTDDQTKGRRACTRSLPAILGDDIVRVAGLARTGRFLLKRRNKGDRASSTGSTRGPLPQPAG